MEKRKSTVISVFIKQTLLMLFDPMMPIRTTELEDEKLLLEMMFRLDGKPVDELRLLLIPH